MTAFLPRRCRNGWFKSKLSRGGPDATSRCRTVVSSPRQQKRLQRQPLSRLCVLWKWMLQKWIISFYRFIMNTEKVSSSPFIWIYYTIKCPCFQGLNRDFVLTKQAKWQVAQNFRRRFVHYFLRKQKYLVFSFNPFLAI